MKKVNHFILKLLGYKIDTVNIPPEAKKCVLMFAPHTSMLDFVIGRMSLSAMGVKTYFMIKSEAFWWPLGPMLKALGGVPVNRKNAVRVHLFASETIKNSDEIALLIAPEGTRQLVKNWKKGCFHIAMATGVPIALGYLDYKSRKGGIGGMFYPTGDIEADMADVQKFYYGMQGRHKGLFNLENEEYAHPEWLEKG